MVSLRELKVKYKNLKYQHIKKIYAKNLAVLPENCVYNKQIQLPNRSRLNICTFNLEDNEEVDLCYKPEHSKNCNAFCPNKTKEQLLDGFLNDIKDDHIRATNYKDINTLYWLCPELIQEDFPDTKRWYTAIVSFFRRIF